MEEMLSTGGEVTDMYMEMSPVEFEFDAALLPRVVDADPNRPDMMGGKMWRGGGRD